MVTILMISSKMVTLGLLKIKVFWSKGYDVIISFHDITNGILSSDSNYIADVVMWPKFGNSSISIREVIITSILWEFDQKNQFFWGVVLIPARWFGTGARHVLEILYQCGEMVKIRIQIGILPILAILCTSEQLFQR